MADKVIFGENAVFSTDSRETGLNNNVAVCGASGSGKTTSYTEARLLETVNSSLITTMTKRRLINKYKPLFEQRGYDVQDLNFINPSQSTVAFDPLCSIKSYSDITHLAEAIVKSDPQKQHTTADPYWDQTSISLLSSLIAYIIMVYGNGASFADVLKLYDQLEILEEDGRGSSLDDRFARLARKQPNCFAVSCYRSFKEAPIRTRRCIYSTLNTILDTMFSPALRKMMAMPNKVDFEQLGTKKVVLFVSTSAVNPALHRFVNIFYAHAFKSLFEFAQKQPGGQLPVPVHIIADDFATGSPILNFAEYISIMREARMSVSLLIQSESQLTGLYGTANATTIINNCDSLMYLGGTNDLQTGRDISTRLNVPLEDVLSMPLKQVCLFRRGQKPIITSRYDIMKDERYQQITQQYEEAFAREL